jgi:hypothetical protein
MKYRMRKGKKKTHGLLSTLATLELLLRDVAKVRDREEEKALDLVRQLARRLIGRRRRRGRRGKGQEALDPTVKDGEETWPFGQYTPREETIEGEGGVKDAMEDEPDSLPALSPSLASSTNTAEETYTGTSKPTTEEVDDQEWRRDSDKGKGELLRAEELVNAGEGEVDVNLVRWRKDRLERDSGGKGQSWERAGERE